MQNSTVSLLTALVTAVAVFLFALAFITAKAARNTLRSAKAAVGPARKTFRSTIGGVVRAGVWVVLLLVALVAWQARDIENVNDPQPSTSSVPGPSASPR
ncbi:hypothetical protein ACWKSP_05290 [Micromonosporaceae bacterium Da 78-11]